MATIIFSDTHLTDQFDQTLFNALKEVIKSADQVIINGDFWDGYLTTFDDFVKSDWKKLFPLLKKKNTIYLYGNHDQKKFIDQRVNLFSITHGDKHSFVNRGVTYHIQHGHQFKKSIFTKIADVIPHSWSVKIFTWSKNQNEQKTLIGKFLRFIEYQFDLKLHHQFLEHFSKKNVPKNHKYVFGHTHIKYVNENSSYLNPGRFTKRDLARLILD